MNRTQSTEAQSGEDNEMSEPRASLKGASPSDLVQTPAPPVWRPGHDTPPFVSANGCVVSLLVGILDGSTEPPRVRISDAVAIQMYELFRVNGRRPSELPSTADAMYRALALRQQQQSVGFD